MNRETPVLCDVLDSPSGLVLVLDDESRLRLNLAPTVLQAHLAASGFPSLDAICRSQNAKVYHFPMRMTEQEWATISRILRTSPDSVELREYRELRDGMDLLFAKLQKMPLRLYCGVGQFLNGNGPDLYTLHPFDFHETLSRDRPWRYCLLSAHGDRLFHTYVNVEAECVEITSEVKLHFVEP
jgi:hypothetical protein